METRTKEESLNIALRVNKKNQMHIYVCVSFMFYDIHFPLVMAEMSKCRDITSTPCNCIEVSTEHN